MGANSSQTDGSVPPELLASELLGEVRDDDYFAVAAKTLDLLQNEDFNHSVNEFKSEDALNLEDVFKMQEEGYLNMEDGFVRCRDGTLFVACLTDFGAINSRDSVNGEMFDWWIRNCDDTEKYKWWHPRAHKSATWNPQFYAVMPHERKSGHYVDNTHMVEIELGGEGMMLKIEYTRPSKYFEVSSFASNGITACFVARILMKHKSLGFIGVGTMVHMMRENEGRNELRSRYWLGNIAYPETVDNFAVARIINYFSNLYWTRYMKIPLTTAREIWLETKQEMRCLARILPHYYRAAYIRQPQKYKEVENERKTSSVSGPAPAATQTKYKEVEKEARHPGAGTTGHTNGNF